VPLVDPLNFANYILNDWVFGHRGLLCESAITETCCHWSAPFSGLDHIFCAYEIIAADYIKIDS
jgi:hypothetical protein